MLYNVLTIFVKKRNSGEKKSNNIQCPGLPHFIHYINLYYYDIELLL